MNGTSSFLTDRPARRSRDSKMELKPKMRLLQPKMKRLKLIILSLSKE